MALDIWVHGDYITVVPPINTGSTVPQDTERTEGINFRVPASFKLQVDLAVVRLRSTLRAVCIKALAQHLQIPHPREDAKKD